MSRFARWVHGGGKIEMGAWFKWATAELVVCSMAMAPELIGHVRHIDLRPAYGGNHVPSSTTTLMLFPHPPRGPENGIERERLELSAGHACNQPTGRSRVSRRDWTRRAAQTTNSLLIRIYKTVSRSQGRPSSSPTVAGAPCLARSDAQAFSYKHVPVNVSHKSMGKDPTGWLITQNRAG